MRLLNAADGMRWMMPQEQCGCEDCRRWLGLHGIIRPLHSKLRSTARDSGNNRREHGLWRWHRFGSLPFPVFFFFAAWDTACFATP